jgi:hypothetical protein
MNTLTIPEDGVMAGHWRNEPVVPNPAAYSVDGHLLLLLTATWELQTGRICPSWPLTEASDGSLIAFWADPEMEPADPADIEGEASP